MPRTFHPDTNGTHQLTDFAARLNRTKYSDKPTRNRRNQRRNSSDFSPVRRMGNGPDACDKPDATEAYHSKLDRSDTGFQVTRGQTRDMHFMPAWEPVCVYTGTRIAWLPACSEYVTPKERQLARIAVLLESGQPADKIARKLGMKLRTIERRIAYLLSSQPDTAKSGGQSAKRAAKVEGKPLPEKSKDTICLKNPNPSRSKSPSAGMPLAGSLLATAEKTAARQKSASSFSTPS
jgi:hypothetical protein